jgi:hypothetical protein
MMVIEPKHVGAVLICILRYQFVHIRGCCTVRVDGKVLDIPMTRQETLWAVINNTVFFYLCLTVRLQCRQCNKIKTN